LDSGFTSKKPARVPAKAGKYVLLGQDEEIQMELGRDMRQLLALLTRGKTSSRQGSELK
jgi:hypothetical protein